MLIEPKIYLTILGIGILAVTILDSVGSIASRKLNFNYSALSGFSFLIYAIIGYYSASKIDMISGLTITGLVALFDAVIGWKICVALEANWGNLEELLGDDLNQKELDIPNVLFMVVLGIFIGWIGTLFA